MFTDVAFKYVPITAEKHPASSSWLMDVIPQTRALGKLCVIISQHRQQN